MTSSNSEESPSNLELECRALSRALAGLPRDSPEWSFLQRKLEAAKDELAATNSDGDGRRQTTKCTPTDERRPMIDDVEVIGGASGPASSAHHRFNLVVPNRPKRLKRANVLAPASETDNGAAAATGAATSRTKTLALSLLLTVASLLCVVIIALPALRGGGDGSDSSADTAVPGAAGDNGPRPFLGPCAPFAVHLIPDQFGNETSWTLVRQEAVELAAVGAEAAATARQGVVVLEGGPYEYRADFEAAPGGRRYAMVHAATCLPAGSYRFVLRDAGGDGICCAYGRGEYALALGGRAVRPLGPGRFEGDETTPFDVGPGDVAPAAAPAGRPPERAPDAVAAPCASFSLHLILDQFGNETTWALRNYDGVDLATIKETHRFSQGAVVLAGGPYEYREDFEGALTGSHYQMIRATSCLPVGTYGFVLYDAGGDGICCTYGRGEYGIDLSKGRVVRPMSAGEFSGTGAVTPFEVGPDDVDILPPSSLTAEGAVGAGPYPVPAGLDAETGPCAFFSMQLVPDHFGNETSWEVLRQVVAEENRSVSAGRNLSPTFYPTYNPTPRRLGHNAENSPRKVQQTSQQWNVVLAGGPYTYSEGAGDDADGSHYNAIVAETCLLPGLYKFVLHDAAGDGICCRHGRGEYALALAGRAIRPLTPGRFAGTEEETPFNVAAKDVGPRPAPASPAAAPSAAEVSEVRPDSPAHDNWRPATIIHSLASLATVPPDRSDAGRGKAYGILFSVECTVPLIVTGMDLYIDGRAETRFQIWTKPGSWNDVDNTDSDYFSGFRQISHGSIVGKGASDFARIALQDFADVEMQRGQQQAFYVTLTDNRLVYAEGTDRHEMNISVQAENDEFTVFYGAAVRAYPLGLADPVTDFWYNAGFLGRLWYRRSDR